MSKWFTANKLVLNLDKTNLITFLINNSPQFPLSIGYNDNCIEESVNTKFIGLQIHNHLNWKNHIDRLVPKLSGAHYADRSMLLISNTDTLKTIYFAYFHSLMKYGIIVEGNSPDSKTVFTLQTLVEIYLRDYRSLLSCVN
jgi:hypothetical protein